MKKKERIKILSILALILIVIIIITFGKNKITNKITGGTKAETEQSTLSLSYQEMSKEDNIVYILIKVSDEENGLKEIQSPDGTIINAKGKKKLAIDYKVEKEKEYKFKLVSETGEEKEEIICISDKTWDGWIKLSLYYPYNAVEKQWRLGNKGEVRSDKTLEWNDYTGPITIPMSRTKDVWIKYKINNQQIIQAPEDTVLTYIENEKIDKKKQKITITYDEDATVKEFNIDGEGWQEYKGEFEVEKSCLIMARAKKQIEVKDADGNLIAKQDKWGTDNKYIFINEEEQKQEIPDSATEIAKENNILKAPTITITPETEQTNSVKVKLETEKQARNIYIKIGDEEYKEYTEEITVTKNTLISAYYISDDGYESLTSYKRITNIKNGKLPYLAIIANPYPYPGDTGRENVEISLDFDDAINVEYSEDGITYYSYLEPFTVNNNKRIYARATNLVGTTVQYLDITNIGKITDAPEEPKNNTSSGNTSGGNTSSGNTSSGNTSGGNTSGGNTSSGNTSGGNTSGGNTSGGNTSGGNTSGGNTSGGNTSGGNTSGGNTSDGNTSGGNTSDGNTSSGNTSSGNTSDGNTSSGNTSGGNTNTGNTSGGNTGGGTSENIPPIEENDKYTILNKNEYRLIKLKYPSEAIKKEYKVRDLEWKEYNPEGILLVKPEYKDKILDENGNLKGKIQNEKGKPINFNGDIYVLNIDYDKIYENISIRWNAWAGEAPTIIPSTQEPAKNVTIGISYNKGLVKKQYKLKYEDQTETEWLDYTKPFVVDKNNTTVYARGLDNVEVYTNEAAYNITNIDNEPPEITVKGDLETPIRNLQIQILVKDKNKIDTIKWAEGKQNTEYFNKQGENIKNGTRKIISDNGIFTVYAKDIVGNETAYELSITNIDLSAVPNPTIEFDKEPYVIDGIAWYPYGTRATIHYAEDMTNQTGYYNSKIGEKEDTAYNWNGWNSNSTNTTYSRNLSETLTIQAKIIDTTGEESEVLEEEIHVMGYEGYLQSNYRIIGNIYPVLIDRRPYDASNYLYGTDTYWIDNTYIYQAAKHAGVTTGKESTENPKVVKIKIVECPEEGYKASTRNGMRSSAYYSTSYYGFVFIDEQGNEVKGPTIESVSQVPDEDKVTVSIEAKAYNGASIEKYYYKIDNGEYVESTNNTYTFTDLAPYVNHTIKVHAIDSRGTETPEETLTQRTTKKITTPTITYDKEPYVIDGIKWYPYGTRATIHYAEDMTNQTGYIRTKYGEKEDTTYNFESWRSNSTNTTYSMNLSETLTIQAKITDTTGEESEVLEEEIHVMGYEGYLQSDYRIIGNIYPVLIDRRPYDASNYLYGTDTYWIDNTYIYQAAKHAGVTTGKESTENPKVVKIKIVECPEEGYKASTRNGMRSSAYYSTSYYGFVFIDEQGNEVKGPTIESVSQVPDEDKVTVSIEAKAYNGASIEKYYYKIDNGEYVESTNNTYTFTDLTPYVSHSITVYAVDSNNTETLPKTIYTLLGRSVTLSGYKVVPNGNYVFYNEDDILISSNVGITNSVASSYIELDLSNYSADTNFEITLNASIDSEGGCDIGYATITKDITAPTYSGSDFIHISGTVESKDYTTTVTGGNKYYLHLGYRKDGSVDTGKDRVEFRNLRVNRK